MKLATANISQLTALARIAFQSNRFLAIYGKGGVGKTTIPKTIIAPALGFDETWIINLSGSQPADAIGYGIPDSTTRDMWFSCPEQFPTAKRVGKKRILLVLDEYPEWDLGIQSLCRSLFNPHGSPRIGTHELGENVKIIVTGNRRSDGTRSAVPAAPFVERCLSVCVEPTLDEWLEWAAIEGLAGSPVYAFLRFRNGEGVDHFNPDVPMPWDGSPHACPRAWEAACRIDADEDPAMFSLALRGLVGEASGSAAYAFTQLVAAFLPKLAAIRAGTEPLPSDPSEQHALLHAAVRVARKEAGKDPEAAVASGALDWLARLIGSASGEIRAWAYTSATRNGVPLDQHPMRSAMQGI
jgi:hypothetical protein